MKQFLNIVPKYVTEHKKVKTARATIIKKEKERKLGQAVYNYYR